MSNVFRLKGYMKYNHVKKKKAVSGKFKSTINIFCFIWYDLVMLGMLDFPAIKEKARCVMISVIISVSKMEGFGN